MLHDGAPNVGTAWVQDAFSQAELVLHSLKLAVETLAPNGTFVTKVFRSKDYTSLLYVFNQLFRTVEATKPPSSRNVSAEIFVVCQGFLAPKKVDPRLLDPAHVFKEVSAAAAGTTNEGDDGDKLTPAAQNVFHPEKKRRAREGYDEGDLTLFKAVPASDLVHARDPVKVLSRASRFDFGTEEEKRIGRMKATTAEVRSIMEDLKVLGKAEFKRLLKWRTAVREELGLDVKIKPVAEATEHGNVEPIDEDVQMEEEVGRAAPIRLDEQDLTLGTDRCSCRG